jgi:hypothetical protein
MKKAELELYTDYLLSRFGQATATGLSAMVNGEMSHDQVTRFLSEREYTSKDLWCQVKPTVRQIERDDGVLIFERAVFRTARVEPEFRLNNMSQRVNQAAIGVADSMSL